MSDFLFFFFFQAEDGIRDLYVTGVQTCALPISVIVASARPRPRWAFSGSRDKSLKKSTATDRLACAESSPPPGVAAAGRRAGAPTTASSAKARSRAS